MKNGLNRKEINMDTTDLAKRMKEYESVNKIYQFF